MKLNDILPKLDFVKLILPHKRAKSAAARWAPVRSKIVKILILGLDEVGKTSLVSKLCGRDVKENSERTLYDVYETEIAVDDCSVRFQFMDLASPYVFPTMLDVFIQQADMFILVYSADDAKSFDELTKLRHQVARVKNRHTTQLPIVVVNNKVDVMGHKLTKKGYLRRKSVSNWCSQSVDVSAKTGYNINAVMETLIKESKFIGNKDEPVGEPSVSGTYIYGGDDEDADAGCAAEGSGKKATRSKAKRSVSIQFHGGPSTMKRRVNSERRRLSVGSVAQEHHTLKQQRSRSFDFSLLKRASRTEMDRKQSHDKSTWAQPSPAPTSRSSESSNSTPSTLPRGPVVASPAHSRSSSPKQDAKIPVPRKTSGRRSAVSPFPCSYALATSMRARSLPRTTSEGSLPQADACSEKAPGAERRDLNSNRGIRPEEIARSQSLRAGKACRETPPHIQARCRSTSELSDGLIPSSGLSPSSPLPTHATCSSQARSDALTEACAANEKLESARASDKCETVTLRRKRRLVRRYAVTNAPSPTMIDGAVLSSSIATSEGCGIIQSVSQTAESGVDASSASRPPSSPPIGRVASADTEPKSSPRLSDSSSQDSVSTGSKGKSIRQRLLSLPSGRGDLEKESSKISCQSLSGAGLVQKPGRLSLDHTSGPQENQRLSFHLERQAQFEDEL